MYRRAVARLPQTIGTGQPGQTRSDYDDPRPGRRPRRRREAAENASSGNGNTQRARAAEEFPPCRAPLGPALEHGLQRKPAARRSVQVVDRLSNPARQRRSHQNPPLRFPGEHPSRAPKTQPGAPLSLARCFTHARGRPDRPPYTPRAGQATSSSSPSSPATATRSTTTPRRPARSRFGGLIVQGGVTSGLLNAVVAEDLPGPGSVFLHVDWSFKAPVRPGDEITAEVEVLEAREDKPITRLGRRSRIRREPSSSTAPRSCWTEPL